ncbi:MAG TPA: hypothetical protein VMT89_03140 [Candidatus Acidoferrales bacterium]|nr:hypothetical protein [Candidatus Acidoferrales bacterium]
MRRQEGIDEIAKLGFCRLDEIVTGTHDGFVDVHKGRKINRGAGYHDVGRSGIDCVT